MSTPPLDRDSAHPDAKGSALCGPFLAGLAAASRWLARTEGSGRGTCVPATA